MPALSAVNGSNGWSNGWSHGNHHDFKPATIDLHESPATDGTRMRSVPELIQYNAETNPKTLFCYQATKPAEGSDPDAPPPVAAVTMRQLRDAVHIRTDEEDVGTLNMSTLPLYHGFGLVVPCLALAIGKPFLLPPVHAVPTGLSTARAIEQFGAKSLMTVPHVLDEICALPFDEGIRALLPLQFVACGGGPLKLAVGEKLAAAGVKVLAHFGTTEIGPLAPIFVPPVDYDWRYWRLRDDGFDIKVEPISQDGAATGSGSQQYYQLTAVPFNWDGPFVLQDWLITSDKYPGRDFRAVGRKDDLIVLVTGEKVLPRILESMLSESELVKAAVAFGDGQFELGVIVEPAAQNGVGAEDIEAFKAAIWPIIVEAGRQMDSHAQLSSLASIVVAPPDKPLPRSDKGSVLRKEAYRKFEAEIQKAYDDVDSSTNDSGPPLDPERLEASLKGLVQNELDSIGVKDGVWGYNDDLFELGVNSLQAARIRRSVKRAVSRQAATAHFLPADEVKMDFVYKNPTISRMAEALRPAGQQRAAGRISEQAMIDDYVTRYGILPNPSRRHVILLTGSSGSLGSYFLAHLASLPDVEQVICLIRHRGGGVVPGIVNGEVKETVNAQIKNARSKGAIILPEHEAKIDVVQADPSKPLLGLHDSAYASLCRRVTHILHCAWPVDFQRTMPSFESQFLFLHHLVQLARDSSEQRPSSRSAVPRLLFVSSIAVVGQYHRSRGSYIVPEDVLDDAESTNDFGYGKAKLVCERILAKVAGQLRGQVEVTSVRLGQISGARTGAIWNPKEHFPALIKLSQSSSISALPNLKGTLSWLPVDTAAAAMSEILLSPSPVDLIYHVENPVRQDWHGVMSTIAGELDLELPSALVSLDEWVARAEAGTGSHGQRPADGSSDMLIDFFKHDFERMATGGVVLDTSKARRVSETLRRANSVEPALVARYVQEWKRCGFFN
ncbi:hypothetical protein B0T24DRAFT_532261 [Lasiosphaeria ovina]|uniref:Carrier domain-containing protein n=1 Tax=Lasiosphaeria ovina TaxID=92902 RepID=A0AAE0N521_9PEZI|nr:hypothetical protein B0T24DRAFT_532261 [Lasiosphaeria ovina]